MFESLPLTKYKLIDLLHLAYFKEGLYYVLNHLSYK